MAEDVTLQAVDITVKPVVHAGFLSSYGIKYGNQVWGVGGWGKG